MISLLVVNYRSAALAAEAIRSARAASSESLHVVVVDNSCDEHEAAQLRPHADVLIAAERNLGYAAAINRGRPECRGDVVIAANPDVVFGANAIDELAAAIRSGFAAAGPALYWDAAHEWILPPSELQTLTEKLDEAFASRSAAWMQWRDRRRIEDRIGFWSLKTIAAVPAISGAVMAISTNAFDRASGFDEQFELYFEETDFLRRVEKSGGRVAYVPPARCRHLFNQSAGGDPERASSLYAESERKYLLKWGGAAAAKLVRAIQRPAPAAGALPAMGPIAVKPGQLVEASPLPTFSTAAGHFARSTVVDVPAEVWDAYKSPVLYLRVVNPATARVLATYARYRT